MNVTLYLTAKEMRLDVLFYGVFKVCVISKTDFLYALDLAPRKGFILVRQQFHCAVAEFDQVDQHFNPLVAAYNITA